MCGESVVQAYFKVIILVLLSIDSSTLALLTKN